MKLKRILIIMLCLLITGCKANETEANDKLDMQYKKYTQKLIEQREFSDESDEFSIRLVLNKINDNEIACTAILKHALGFILIIKIIANIFTNNDKIIMSNIKYIEININPTINIAKNKLINKGIIFILFI